MSKAKNDNTDFDYQMELRIVSFDNDKARSFIYQEDQKTKMRKVTSDSFNVFSAANIVAEKMNESPKCNLQGRILRVNGIIDFSIFADMINYFYFKNNKNDERLEILNVTKELIECFNIVTEENPKYMQEPISFKELITMMTVFFHFKGKDKSEMYEVLENTLKNVEKSKSTSFSRRKAQKRTVNEVEKCMEGGM